MSVVVDDHDRSCVKSTLMNRTSAEPNIPHMRDNGETCFNVVVLKPSGEVGDSKDRHILTHNVFEG
jgi:hypothetical protein